MGHNIVSHLCKARSEPCMLTWCALLVLTAALITPENHPKPSDMPTAAPEPVPPATTTKSYEEIILVLKSLPAKKLKGTRLEVNSEFFGTEWAASDDCKEPRCVGIVDKWKTQNAVLMVKWDGWSTNRQTPLDSLDTDADNMSLKLKLLPYANGDAPPEFVEDDEQPAVGARGGGGRGMPRLIDRAREDEDEDETTQEAEVDCHGQIWSAAEPEGVATDARTMPRTKPSLNRGDRTTDTIDKLFNLLLPQAWVEDTIKYTNHNLDEHDAAHLKIGKGDLLRWWGYALSLSLNTGTPTEKMWSHEPIAESVLPPPRMGRHGMSKNRWKAIRSALAFGPSDDASFDRDEWCFVDPMVTAFNEQMADVVNPGWLLCVDETMSAWRGKQGKRDSKKCPKLSWVPRKPEPLGTELKTAGCALSGMIITVEICKGKETHKDLEFFKEKSRFDASEYGHTTATTLRLIKPWFGTQRVLGGDSWFASVKTAEACAERGIYFVGDVKTATRRFCGAALNEATGPESGAWATYTSELTLGGGKTMPIYSVSHRRGESVHKFVATCGTTLKGSAHLATFEDEEDRVYASDDTKYELTRKCPRILNDWTLAQPCIDRHNRYRQFILGMEKRLITNNFSLRLATTLMGMLFTNAFFAHRHFNSELADFKEEMGKLAYRLMHNPHAPEPVLPPTPQTRTAGSPNSPPDASHPLMQLSKFNVQHGIIKKTAALRCVVCNKKTSWYCTACTEGPHSIVPVCPCTTRGSGRGGAGCREHACEAFHCQHPNFRKSQSKKRTKRARRDEHEPIFAGESEDED